MAKLPKKTRSQKRQNKTKETVKPKWPAGCSIYYFFESFGCTQKIFVCHLWAKRMMVGAGQNESELVFGLIYKIRMNVMKGIARREEVVAQEGVWKVMNVILYSGNFRFRMTHIETRLSKNETATQILKPRRGIRKQGCRLTVFLSICLLLCLSGSVVICLQP